MENHLEFIVFLYMINQAIFTLQSIFEAKTYENILNFYLMLKIYI